MSLWKSADIDMSIEGHTCVLHPQEVFLVLTFFQGDMLILFCVCVYLYIYVPLEWSWLLFFFIRAYFCITPFERQRFHRCHSRGAYLFIYLYMFKCNFIISSFTQVDMNMSTEDRALYKGLCFFGMPSGRNIYINFLYVCIYLYVYISIYVPLEWNWIFKILKKGLLVYYAFRKTLEAQSHSRGTYLFMYLYKFMCM